MEVPTRSDGVTILADHNLEGQALLLWNTLAADGWLDLLPLRLVTLYDLDLPADTSDRQLWRYVQERRMVLLTGNRTMRRAESLEQAIRDENTPTSLPVLTLSNAERMEDCLYRERCASRLVEISIDLQFYLGAGRLYLP